MAGPIQQLSAGVVTTEIDLTTVVPTSATTVGAFVGQFVWGPANTVTLVPTEQFLSSKFGRPDTNTALSFFSCANFLAYGDNLLVGRAAGTNANNATSGASGVKIENSSIYQQNYFNGQGSTIGAWAGRYPGDYGNSLFVSTCPSSNAWSQNVTAASTFTAQTFSNTTVLFTGNVAPYIVPGDVLNIGSLGGVVLLTLNTSAGGNVATVNAIPSGVVSANGFSRSWAYKNYFQSAPGTSSYATQQGGANDEMHVVVIDSLGKFTGVANTVLETYPFVSKAAGAINNDNSPNYVRDVVFGKSQYIHWLSNPSVGTNWGNSGSTIFTDVGYNFYTPLANGFTDTVTDGNLEAVWAQNFANPEAIQIDLVISGAADTTVANYLISSIGEVRRDCVVFVSPLLTDVVNAPGSEATNIITTRNALPSSSYAFMDSGWKYMYDRYNNIYRWVPLNPDIAGLCVFTDLTTAPWFSIAGFNRGNIKNVIKLAWNPSKPYRDQIYPLGINPVVNFPGQGPILYGDATLLNKPSAFNRINVRRLFIVLERSISAAAKFSLFEFNDEFTRSQFFNLVDPFMRDVKARRGVSDYQIVCDTTNNTPQVIQNNQFVGDIYVKPNYSINWITLNFIAVGTGVSFSQVVGAF